jgi:hypothetical protein
MSAHLEEYAHLLASPAPAVLTTYRKDGTALASPVWFRYHDLGFEVVIAEGDVKLRHLAANPRCSLVIFNVFPPLRGVRVEGPPELLCDGVSEARLAIASRYLGTKDAERFVAKRGPGVVLRLSPDQARGWLTVI